MYNVARVKGASYIIVPVNSNYMKQKIFNLDTCHHVINTQRNTFILTKLDKDYLFSRQTSDTVHRFNPGYLFPLNGERGQPRDIGNVLSEQAKKGSVDVLKVFHTCTCNLFIVTSARRIRRKSLIHLNNILCIKIKISCFGTTDNKYPSNENQIILILIFSRIPNIINNWAMSSSARSSACLIALFCEGPLMRGAADEWPRAPWLAASYFTVIHRRLGLC